MLAVAADPSEPRPERRDRREDEDGSQEAKHRKVVAAFPHDDERQSAEPSRTRLGAAQLWLGREQLRQGRLIAASQPPSAAAGAGPAELPKSPNHWAEL